MAARALSRPAALALLRRAPHVHIATTLADGTPLFRTFHGVVVGDGLCFHMGPRGEKAGAIGRPAVACAVESLATLPSTWLDPRRACPATTWFRSVHVHGTLEPVEDPAAKAAILEALMRRFQPEGGYVPIRADHPLYAKAVAHLLILRLPLARLTTKEKLGGKPPAKLAAIAQGLWRRGAPGDLSTLEALRVAEPALAPEFLEGPPGVRLHAEIPADDLGEALDLLAGAYWTRDATREQLSTALRGSAVRVGARASGGLIGFARALSDGARRAWIYDVIVAPAWRGRGVGSALMRLLLDHPRLREVARIELSTRDADPLYARFGFETVGSIAREGMRSKHMIRARSPLPA